METNDRCTLFSVKIKSNWVTV